MTKKPQRNPPRGEYPDNMRVAMVIDFNTYEKKRTRILSDIRFYSDVLALNEGTPNEVAIREHLEAAQNALQRLDRMASEGMRGEA